jgi:tetratricopeptide (TPR) repeat protein
MKRRHLILAVAACVAILVVGVILLCCLKDDDEKDLGESATAGTVEGKARRPRPPALHLHLSLNWGSAATIAGTPLRIEVWLNSPLGVRARWLEHQIKRYKAKEQPTPVQEKILADWQAELDERPAGEIILRSEDLPVAGWVTFELLSGRDYLPLPWKVQAVSVPEGRELSVGAEPRLLVYFVPPEATEKIPRGAHRIRAKLAGGLATEAVGGLVSEPCRVQILDGEKANVYVRLHSLHRAGLYYLETGDPDKAHEQVRQILAIDPERVEAHALLGDVHEARGKLEEAYQAYSTAMEIVLRSRPDDGPPRALIRREKELWAKLAAKLAKQKVGEPDREGFNSVRSP